MYKIGLIGDRDTTMGFRALGLATFEVSGQSDTEQAVLEVMRDNFAVVLITERAYARVAQMLHEHRDRALPVYSLIPDNQGSIGLGQKRLSKMIERAIGVDILFKEVGKN
ncbi:MAG: hypothetical protein KGZ50_12020 [Peptococcaceae bacterium]|nr:hypothetical protein [Peptococcaceae bacterium]